MIRPLSISAFVLALTAGHGFSQALEGGFGSFRAGIDRSTIEQDPAFALFLAPAIAAELKLSDAQVTELKKIADVVIAGHRDDIARAIAEDRQAQDTLNATRTKEQAKMLVDVLARHLTAEQRKRGRQLELQSIAMAAFRDDEVIRELKLTDSQIEAAKKSEIDLSAELSRLSAARNSPLGGPTASFSSEARDLRRTTARKAVDAFVASLSPEQAMAWAGMVGEPSNKISILLRSPASSSFRTNFWFSLANRPRTLSPIRTPLADELKLSEEKLTAFRNDLTAAQRIDKIIEPGPSKLFPIRQAIDRELITMAEKLLKPEQLEQLTPIQWRIKGPWAFDDIAVLKEMKFTPAQSAAIEKGGAKVVKKYTEAFPRNVGGQRGFGAIPVGPDADARKEKARLAYLSFRKEFLTAVAVELHDDQKKIFDQMFKETFDLTKLGNAATGFAGGFDIQAENWLAESEGWSPAAGWRSAAWTMESSGRYAEAKAAFEESLRLQPENPDAQDALAWFLATCPDDAIWNATTAINLATKACEKSQHKMHEYHLTTLAAAYAAGGRFGEAVKTQEQAIARMKRSSDPSGIGSVGFYEERLKQFKENQPFRSVPSDPYSSADEFWFGQASHDPLNRSSIGQGPAFNLLLDPAIAAALQITDEQRANLKKLPDDLLARHKDAIAKASAEDGQIRNQVNANRTKILDEKMTELLAKHLTEEQRKRGRQLEIQSMATDAFLNEEIAHALKLSDTKKDAAKQANARLMVDILETTSGIRFDPFNDGGSAITVNLTNAKRATVRKAVDSIVKLLSTSRQPYGPD